MTHEHLGFSSRAIHAGQEPDPTTGAVVPPIHQVSTYKQDGIGNLRGGYEYSRSANPTRTALEECIAALEGGERGFAFASGLAGEDTLLRALLAPGDHVVVPSDAYGGTYRLFDQVARPWGVEHSIGTVADVESVRAAIRPETRMVWLETPTNPLLGIADIGAIAKVTHEAGALLVVDNTFASPYLQQPIALGADVVVHSTTKYAGGHSDVVGGAVVVAAGATTRDGASVAERVAYHQNAMGAVAGPFDAWLVLRGLKTLAVRMERHCDNAEAVVDFLLSHAGRHRRALPRPAGPPQPRCRRPADEAVRRHGRVPGQGRRGRRHEGLRGDPAVDPRRVPRRCRVAHRAPGPDDPRVGLRHRARGAVGPHPTLRRHRGRRGPRRRPPPGARPAHLTPVVLVLCVDVGSTFTKAVLVDAATGDVLGTASHPTTVATDVMDGVDAVRASLAGHGEPDEVLACSSAGGGLRLAVVGYEREVTAEAGHRVGLSAGAKVVHVASGPMTGADVAALRAAAPDLVLLVGGTDGGNADVLLHNAERLARGRLAAPVVVAGNADAADGVAALLAGTGRRHVVTDNVLPRIGVVAPEAARAAIREAFLTHVIGGKGLSRGRGFAELVRAPTPDAVLRGVEVLAEVVGGDVLVVDVGGATTDVYSVITPQGEDATIHREVVGTLWHARTVEADLGMRWTAPSVVEAGERERMPLSDTVIRYAGAVASDTAHLAVHGGGVDGRGGARGNGRGCRRPPARPSAAPVGAPTAARRRRPRRRVRRRPPPRAGRRRRQGARARHRRPRWGVAGAGGRLRAGRHGIRALRRRAAR